MLHPTLYFISLEEWSKSLKLSSRKDLITLVIIHRRERWHTRPDSCIPVFIIIPSFPKLFTRPDFFLTFLFCFFLYLLSMLVLFRSGYSQKFKKQKKLCVKHNNACNMFHHFSCSLLLHDDMIVTLMQGDSKFHFWQWWAW